MLIMRRSPSWGAWIEIVIPRKYATTQLVAPPRGERGLKLDIRPYRAFGYDVAPPRGERGLKYYERRKLWLVRIVAPPRGERGLKSVLKLKTKYAKL